MFPRTPFHFVCVAAVLAMGNLRCSHICTDVGCVDSQTLTIRASTADLPPGNYTIDIVAGQTTATVNCNVQAPPNAAACSGGPPDAFGAIQKAADGATVLSISTSLLGPLGVKVSRDGVEVPLQRGSTNSRTNSPNGPDCEPHCTTYTENITI